MREKGWEERGPKAHSKNSDFSTPLIQVLFSGLPIVSEVVQIRLLECLVNYLPVNLHTLMTHTPLIKGVEVHPLN